MTARSYPVALRDEPATDVAPFDCSRFPVSVLDDACATEGAAHEPVGYWAGLAAECDWWTVGGVVVGSIAGYVLSVLYPNGFIPPLP
jgi:hypothetical protein